MRRLVLLMCALALTACRVDATVHVAVEPDGSGSISVELVADAELVAKAPRLGDDLRLDDLGATGWTIDGPVATETGGMRLVVAHPFATVQEADVLLASLSDPTGPLRDLRLDRAVDGRTTTVRLTGALTLGADLSTFADADALAALGAAPYAAELAASGASTSDVVAISLRATLPGSVESNSASGDALSWGAPADGSVATVTAAASRRSGRGVWGSLSSIVGVALVLWVVAGAGFVGYVALARRGRR